MHRRPTRRTVLLLLLLSFLCALFLFVEVLPALAFASPSWPPWLTLSLCLFGQLLSLWTAPLLHLGLPSCRSAHRISTNLSTFRLSLNPFLGSCSSTLPCCQSSTILIHTLCANMYQKLHSSLFRTNTSSATTENVCCARQYSLRCSCGCAYLCGQ